MKITVMDPNYISLKEIDAYESLIWVDRYNKLGDFELCLPIEEDTMKLLVNGNMVTTENSEHGMFINYIDCSTSAESGSKLIVKGISFENILYRRVIWRQTRIQGNFQNGVERLLNENIINPDDPNRTISNFIFIRSEDPAIRRITVDRQFTGDNLGEAIETMCFELGVGFKVILNENNVFEFSLYKGLDRTFAQDKNNYVEFSIPLENLVNSKYVESDENYRNVSLVAGEGEGSRRFTAIAGDANSSGLSRFELYTDARDLSTVKDSEGDEEEYYTNEEYESLLIDRGNKYLLEHEKSRVFDSQAETNLDFTYRVDYNIGDIVQTKDGYGHEGFSRITEYIMSYNESGYTAYPTFDVVYDATDIKDEIEEPDTLQITVYNPHTSNTVTFNADSYDDLPYGFTAPNSDYNWPGPAMVLKGCEYPFAYFSDLFAYGDFYHIRVTIIRIRDNKLIGTFEDCICRYSVADRVDPNYTKEGYLQYGDHSSDQDPDDPDESYEPEDPEEEEEDPDAILWPIHYRVTVKSDWKGSPYEPVTEFGIESYAIIPGGYDIDAEHYDPPAIVLNGCRAPSSELTRVFSNSSVPKSFTITPDKDNPGSTDLVHYTYPPFRSEVDQPVSNEGDILTKGNSIITCYSVHMGGMEIGDGGTKYVEAAYFDYVFDNQYFWGEIPDPKEYRVIVMDNWYNYRNTLIDEFMIDDYFMVFTNKVNNELIPTIRLKDILYPDDDLRRLFDGVNLYGFTIIPSNKNTSPKQPPDSTVVKKRTTKFPPFDTLTRKNSLISCFGPKVVSSTLYPGYDDRIKESTISYKYDNVYEWGESEVPQNDWKTSHLKMFNDKFYAIPTEATSDGYVLESEDGMTWTAIMLPIMEGHSMNPISDMYFDGNFFYFHSKSMTEGNLQYLKLTDGMVDDIKNYGPTDDVAYDYIIADPSDQRWADIYGIVKTANKHIGTSCFCRDGDFMIGTDLVNSDNNRIYTIRIAEGGYLEGLLETNLVKSNGFYGFYSITPLQYSIAKMSSSPCFLDVLNDLLIYYYSGSKTWSTKDGITWYNDLPKLSWPLYFENFGYFAAYNNTNYITNSTNRWFNLEFSDKDTWNTIDKQDMSIISMDYNEISTTDNPTFVVSDDSHIYFIKFSSNSNNTIAHIGYVDMNDRTFMYFLRNPPILFTGVNPTNLYGIYGNNRILFYNTNANKFFSVPKSIFGFIQYPWLHSEPQTEIKCGSIQYFNNHYIMFPNKALVTSSATDDDYYQYHKSNIYIFISDDLINWTPVRMPISASIENQYVVIADDTLIILPIRTVYKVSMLLSKDGINFTYKRLFDNSLGYLFVNLNISELYTTNILYENGIVILMTATSNNKSTIISEDKGKTWTEYVISTDIISKNTSIYSCKLLFGNGIFLIVFDRDNVAISYDGKNWLKESIGVSAGTYYSRHGVFDGQYFILKNLVNGSKKFARSLDGISWEIIDAVLDSTEGYIGKWSGIHKLCSGYGYLVYIYADHNSWSVTYSKDHGSHWRGKDFSSSINGLFGSTDDVRSIEVIFEEDRMIIYDTYTTKHLIKIITYDEMETW